MYDSRIRIIRAVIFQSCFSEYRLCAYFHIYVNNNYTWYTIKSHTTSTHQYIVYIAVVAFLYRNLHSVIRMYSPYSKMGVYFKGLYTTGINKTGIYEYIVRTLKTVSFESLNLKYR